MTAKATCRPSSRTRRCVAIRMICLPLSRGWAGSRRLSPSLNGFKVGSMVILRSAHNEQEAEGNSMHTCRIGVSFLSWLIHVLFTTVLWFSSMAISVDYYLLLLFAGLPVAVLLGMVSVSVSLYGFPRSTHPRVCGYATFLVSFATIAGIAAFVLSVGTPWFDQVNSPVVAIALAYLAYAGGGILAVVCILTMSH